MSKYIVARINFFDNNLTQELVEAESDVEAVFTLEPYLRDMLEEGELFTMERLKELAFDCNSMVDAFSLEKII